MTTRRVSISLEPEYLERLDSLAEENNTTRSDYIRKFIVTASLPKKAVLSPENYRRIRPMSQGEVDEMMNVLLKSFLDFRDSYKNGSAPDDGDKLVHERHPHRS